MTWQKRQGSKFGVTHYDGTRLHQSNDTSLTSRTDLEHQVGMNGAVPGRPMPTGDFIGSGGEIARIQVIDATIQW